jgi:hypothetical protein
MVEKTTNLHDKSILIENAGPVTINYGDKVIKKHLGSIPMKPEVLLGRDADIEEIRKKLAANHGCLLLVNGEGGIGKTTAASEYYHRYSEEYHHLIWIIAETEIGNALTSLGMELGIKFDPHHTQEENLKETIKELATLKKHSLLIIDNANNLIELEKTYPYLRTCPTLHILLTTRITTFSHAETYPIKHLSILDAQQLFSRHYAGHDHAENDLLDTILNAVNYNTLVIELLAKNMNNFNTILKKRYPLKDMWNDITEGGILSLSKSSDVTTDYKKMKAKPEEIIKAMYNISELSEEEKVLMSVFAVLPATNLPFAHLEELLPEINNLDTLVLSIAQKGWVEFDQVNKCFKTSPVTQEIIRKQHDDKLFEHCKGVIDRLIEKLEYHLSGGSGALVHCTYDTGLTYVLYAEMVCKHIVNFRTILIKNY